MGVGKEAGHCRSDGSEEINASLKKLSWPHDTSTPSRPASNGLTERAAQHAEEGATACALQVRLDEQWLDFAVTCYSFLSNVADRLVLNTSQP